MTVEKAYQKALGYLAKSPKTIYQMKQYLAGKGYGANIIEKVVGQLSDFHYLDDKAFARQFVESRIRYKPKSIYALQFELRKKGIDPALAQELLDAYKDEDLALKAVETKKRVWKLLDESECRKKMMSYLRYRGFNYSVCHAAWQAFQEEGWEDTQP